MPRLFRLSYRTIADALHRLRPRSLSCGLSFERDPGTLTVVVKRRPWGWVVSRGLHFVMSIAMLMMAWPWGAQLPSIGPTVFFALAAMTFVALAGFTARTPALRVRYVYQALMMLGTGWMLP